MISIILPTYNERDCIAKLVEEIENVMDDDEYEILVVDDSSPDGTSDLMRLKFEGIENRHVITRYADRGLVNSINHGISTSRGNICVWMDADMSMPPLLISTMLGKIEDGADLVFGSRYISGGAVKGGNPDKSFNLTKIAKALSRSEDSLLAVLISKVGNKAVKKILVSNLNDFTSGYFAVRKEILEDPPLRGGMVDYCIRFVWETQRRGYKVVEIPMKLTPRQTGKSKTSRSVVSILTVAIECLFVAFQLRFKGERSNMEKQ